MIIFFIIIIKELMTPPPPLLPPSSHHSEPPEDRPWKHDVFLSFRGRDTRNNFTAHLYSALIRRGIKAYRDNSDLARGDSIEPSLFEAIERSRFSIVVFSENYASSAWCLEELVKIVECKRKSPSGHTVFPVFYDVDPSDEEYQKRAFLGYNSGDWSSEKVERWKEAFDEVGKIAGWDARNKDQAEIVGRIAEHIWDQLSHTSQTTMDEEHLVGMDSRIKELNKLIAIGDDDHDSKAAADVRIIGICGMGGIGKTKLARVVYDNLQAKFQGRSCFLPNVRESFEKHGATHVQEHLLSDILMENNIKIRDEEKGKAMIRNCLRDKKVLIVLDDVNGSHQLEALACGGKKKLDWFGPGSLVIVTSRDRRLIDRYDDMVSESGLTAKIMVYNVEKLSDEESLRMLSLKAFHQGKPREGYEDLSKSVLKYCQGLPLAIEVLGCFLNGRSQSDWESQITRLKEEEYYEDGIFEVLKISFDGLKQHEKELFLDVACFLKGKDMSEGKRILESCGFGVDSGFKILAEKSLVTASYGKLEMHDLLQEMGREIVRRESPNNPGKRSRLWNVDDVFDVLEKATGTDEVKAIVLDRASKDNHEQLECNVKAFSKMSRLRLLIMHNVEFDQGPKELSNELRFLDWDGYPSESLPASFRPKHLVELSLCHSKLKQLCCGKAKDFSNLKSMNLSHSLNLIKTPDFSSIPKLERLILEGCTSLNEIQPSIGTHLQNLIHLNLSGCNKISKFPDIVGKMKSLQELLLDETNIEQLPESIHLFTGLSKLSLKGCKSLKLVPKSISSLHRLKVLNLSGCSQLDKLGKVESLEELDVSGTAIRKPLSSILYLNNPKVLPCYGIGFPFMRILSLANCGLMDWDFPEDLSSNLPLLHSLDLSHNNFVILPDIAQLLKLYELHLENCKMLKALPAELPPKINYVVVNGCESLEELPNPVKLRNNLFFLEGFGCPKLQNRQSVGFEMFMKYLQGCRKTLIPREISGIVVPGCSIPPWFTHPSEGNSVKIPIPSIYHNRNLGGDHDHDIWGLAICVAIRVGDRKSPADHGGADESLPRKDSSTSSDHSELPDEEASDAYNDEMDMDDDDDDDDKDDEMHEYSSDSDAMDNDLTESFYSKDLSAPDGELSVDETPEDYYSDSDTGYDHDDDDDYDHDEEEDEMPEYSSESDDGDDAYEEESTFSKKRKYSRYAEEPEEEEEVVVVDPGDHLWYFFIPYNKFTEYLKGQRHIYLELEGDENLEVIRSGCRLVRLGDIEEESDGETTDGEDDCSYHDQDTKAKDNAESRIFYKGRGSYNLCYYEDQMMFIGMYFFYGLSGPNASSSSQTDRASLGVTLYHR